MNDVSQQAELNARYYDSRLNNHGLEKWISPTKWVQRLRFHRVLANLLPLPEESWLDVGCGTADFLSYLREMRIGGDYLGVDIYEPAIEFAARRYKEDDAASFITRDVLDDVINWGQIHTHAWCVALGVFARRDCRLSHANKMFLDIMDFMYRSCVRGCAITVHSTYMTECDENEMAFDPVWVFQQARRMSERVMVDHSYAPHDFMVCLFKEKSPFRKEWERKGGWNSETGE